ncbi:MAG: hypothetical protein KIT39_13610 [Nitrospirales bacterium]|nr:hypothetical protein [Nitrospirales bacterium]
MPVLGSENLLQLGLGVALIEGPVLRRDGNIAVKQMAITPLSYHAR